MDLTVEAIKLYNALEELNCLIIQESFLLRELQQQIRWLTSKFTAIQPDVRDDAGTEQERDRLKALTEAAIDARRVIHDFVNERARQKRMDFLNKLVSFFNDTASVQVAIKKLNVIKAKIEHLVENVGANEFMSSLPSGSFERAPASSAIGLDDNVVGREKVIEAIEERLMSEDKNLHLLWVVGMPGIGKTAIARKVYNSDHIKAHFDVLAWASYGDYYDVVDALMNAQIEALTNAQVGSLDPESVQHYSDFLRNKRILIVVDDCVTYHGRGDLIGGLSCCAERSRILVTSRNATLALDENYGFQDGICSSIYPLGPLSDAQSWELFNIKVCSTSPLPQNLESVGKEIVKRCNGLPTAINHVVTHLSQTETSYEEWVKLLDNTYKQIKCPTPWSYVIRSFPLSLNKCLFYFGFFPKNSTIPVRRLIALWIAEGFVEAEGDKTLVDIAEEYLLKLINLNLIQVTKRKPNGQPKRCCLVYDLREHLTTRARQANSTSSASSTSRSISLGVRQLSHHPEDNGTMASPGSFKLLLSFLSLDYRDGSAPGEQIRNFLYGGINKGCFQFLRVLDLERVYKPGLPKEIGRLIHLRYLGLRWTYLDTLPSSIGNLVNLQTLDIKHTYINTLPKSINNLGKLLYLYLNENHLDSLVPSPPLGHLKKLHTLWGPFLDDESPMAEVATWCPDLRRLGLTCHLTKSAQQDAMAKWIARLPHLQSLWLRAKDQLGRLSDLKLEPFTDHGYLDNLYLFGRLRMKLFKENEFPPNLTELTLSASKLEDDPLPTLERLPHLRILRLYSDAYIGEHMVCTSGGFEQLELLKIWNLEQLKAWTIQDNAMPNLRKLEIRSCKNLEMLPLGLHQLDSLHELMLTDMPKKFTKMVKEDKDKDWYKRIVVQFVNWNGQNSSDVAFASSAKSSFGSLLLLHLLLLRGVPASQAKRTGPRGIPPLLCCRCMILLRS